MREEVVLIGRRGLVGLALGLTVALAACGPGGAPEGSTKDRPAAEVAKDFVPLIDSVIVASKSDGWTFEDSRPWSKTDVRSLRGQVCSTISGKHTLQLVVLGPAVTDPKAAVAGMKKHLEDAGFGISNEFTPEIPTDEHTVTGQRADGAVIDYHASPASQSLDVESECSSTIGLNENVPTGG